MMALSESQKEMQEELDAETARYNTIVRGAQDGHLKKGLYTSQIMERYGEPVVINDEYKGTKKEWVYKAGNESYFSDQKVKLMFNSNQQLESWTNPPPQQDKQK